MKTTAKFTKKSQAAPQIEAHIDMGVFSQSLSDSRYVGLRVMAQCLGEINLAFSADEAEALAVRLNHLAADMRAAEKRDEERARRRSTDTLCKMLEG